MREPLRVMTLEGQLEGLLGQAARADASRRHVIEPDLGRRIVEALQQAAQPLIAEAKPFALVVQPAIRIAIRKLVKTVLPDTPVLSFFEVPEEKAVEVVAVIGAPAAAGAGGMSAEPMSNAFAGAQPAPQAMVPQGPLTYSPRQRPGGDSEALIRQHLPMVRRIAWHVHDR